jgi:hypothetical protein
MDYLEAAWKEKSGFEGISDEKIYLHAVQKMQADLAAAMEDHVRTKVFDVILGNLLHEEVRASLVGKEKQVFETELTPQEGDHGGYNMTAVDVNDYIDFLNPDPYHTLRLVGCTMLICTIKFLLILTCMSQRRKRLREAEYKRLKDGRGLLRSPEGVDEMLKNTASLAGTNSGGRFQTIAGSDARATENSEYQEEEEDSVRIPMPMALKNIR